MRNCWFSTERRTEVDESPERARVSSFKLSRPLALHSGLRRIEQTQDNVDDANDEGGERERKVEREER